MKCGVLTALTYVAVSQGNRHSNNIYVQKTLNIKYDKRIQNLIHRAAVSKYNTLKCHAQFPELQHPVLNLLKSSGNFAYHEVFNIQKSYMVFTLP
jgi:hypothetical protein